MYIWLKKGAEKRLEELQQKGFLGKELKPETHRGTGRKYLRVYEELDPLPDAIPEEELVECVTTKERIHRNFRPEGVYRHEGAELTVKTEVRIHSETSATNIEREEYQEFLISGPSVKAVRTIFTLVRQGKLAPEENWEVGSLRVPVTEAAVPE